MKKFMVLAAAVAAFTVLGNHSVVSADVVLANWTFESSVPTSAGPHVAEDGLFAATSEASGMHASTATVWSNPVGNGSGESFSSNNWAIGDYYQFTTSTLGFQDIIFTWDQTGSSTGPRDFVLQYDVGSGFQNALSFALTGEGWSSGTNNPDSTRSFDFSAISDMNNLSLVTFRLTMEFDARISDGSPVANTGTGRVDNIVIQATAIPEPTSALMLVCGLVGLVGMKRRRA